jgi:hypothetical protein
MYWLAIFGIIIFLFGIFFIIEHHKSQREGFSETKTGIVPPSDCPNVLIKKDSQIYLYNTRKANVPGVNPIIFNNLEEYSEFVSWQHAKGIHCPVLNLEKTYDAQGNEAYKVKTDILQPQHGLPPMRAYGLEQTANAGTPQNPPYELIRDAGHDDPPYNWNQYPAFDSQGQTIGTTTALDVVDSASANNPLYPSPNPMDPNWGGAEFSQQLVDKGFYKENEVAIATPP